MIEELENIYKFIIEPRIVCAWSVLKGSSVMFNCRLVTSTEETAITAKDPLNPFKFYNNDFYIKSVRDDHTLRVGEGEARSHWLEEL